MKEILDAQALRTLLAEQLQDWSLETMTEVLLAAFPDCVVLVDPQQEDVIEVTWPENEL